MAGTLSGTNLSVDSTNTYEAVTGSTSSSTLTDNAIFALKKTSTPTGTTATNYLGNIQYSGKAQNGVNNAVYELRCRALTQSAIPTLQSTTMSYNCYTTDTSNVALLQTAIEHSQSLFRFRDIGLSGGNFGTGGYIFQISQTAASPGSNYDNLLSCGSSSNRYTIVYATTGTINTSDANQKEQIQSLEDVELRVAASIKGMIKKFKWKDAVAKKGDAARIHVGVIAQEVEAAFIAEGLDPARYALFCQDVWWEKMMPNPDYRIDYFKEVPNPDWVEGGDEPETIMACFSSEVEGAIAVHQGTPEMLETFETEVEGGVRKERKGIRYDQLMAFLIAAM